MKILDSEIFGIRFKFKMASKQYLVAELWAKPFWVCFFEKSSDFFKNTQNYFSYISAIKNRSEVVLY